jgi:hypothetical protein
VPIKQNMKKINLGDNFTKQINGKRMEDGPK